eukprot:7987456-Ditylum_brightwellii.AAC.1
MDADRPDYLVYRGESNFQPSPMMRLWHIGTQFIWFSNRNNIPLGDGESKSVQYEHITCNPSLIQMTPEEEAEELQQTGGVASHSNQKGVMEKSCSKRE